MSEGFQGTRAVLSAPPTPLRRVGAVLIVLGGLGLASLFAFSVVLPELVSILIEAFPTTCIGAGLIAIGMSMRERGRIPLLVAGVLELATAVVNVVQMATGSPYGPAPSLLVGFVAIVVAGGFLLFNTALHGPLRWAMAIPAAGIVLSVVVLYAPVPRWAWIDFLPGLEFAAAGLLLLRWDRARPDAH